MANMYTVEQIRAAMRDRNQAEVARRTGIHPMTITKIMNGQDSMNLSTYKKLIDYLFQDKEQYAAAALGVGNGIYNGWYANEEDAVDLAVEATIYDRGYWTCDAESVKEIGGLPKQVSRAYTAGNR